MGRSTTGYLTTGRRTIICSRLAPAGLALAALLSGCGPSKTTTPTPTQEASTQVGIVRGMRVAGAWGEPMVQGVRARILLSDGEAKETESVRASVAFHNTGKRPATLRLDGSPALTGHHVAWTLGDVAAQTDRPVVLDELQGTTLRIGPGETFVTEPVNLVIPPGEGKRELTAAVAFTGATLEAPAVGVTVAAAEWGPVTNGLRMRIGASSGAYPVGTAPALMLYVHNVEREGVRVRPPEWRSLDIDARRERLTFACRTTPEESVELPKGQFWSGTLQHVPLFAPGTYEARFVLTSPEYPAANGSAWSGKLTSNAVKFEVQGK